MTSEAIDRRSLEEHISDGEVLLISADGDGLGISGGDELVIEAKKLA